MCFSDLVFGLLIEVRGLDQVKYSHSTLFDFTTTQTHNTAFKLSEISSAKFSEIIHNELVNLSTIFKHFRLISKNN